LQNRVFFVGATSDPYVFYAVSRFFVLTSSTEGSPVSIMEAMSLGVPAIASDVGGVSDEIENGVDGFVFSPSESPNEIGSLLGFALSDKLKYAQMQARSFEKAKRWYIGKISAQYHDMYLEGTSRVGKK
jgi:glycosyltransferase involved in cell wall biosynthesis